MEKSILLSATRIVLLLITLAIIVLAFLQVEVWEPLKTLSIMVFSFYFGQKSITQK